MADHYVGLFSLIHSESKRLGVNVMEPNRDHWDDVADDIESESMDNAYEACHRAYYGDRYDEEMAALERHYAEYDPSDDYDPTRYEYEDGYYS